MPGADLFLPEGVSVFAAALVIVLAFASSAITAALGVGGGVVLLAVMSLAFPPAAVVPVHGVAQLGANASRLGFLWRHVDWRIIAWFTLGGVAGTALGARLVIEAPVWALRAGLGGFILVSLWAPKPSKFAPGSATYAATGALGSTLTMFFGATGPLSAAMLAATRLDRLAIVSTHAATMVAQHGLKTAAFGVVGFSFGPWAGVIGAILAAGFAGAWVGSRLLQKSSERRFLGAFRLLLTAVALYLIGIGIKQALDL